MDKITGSLVEEFTRERQLDRLTESQTFESFAAYCVVSNEYDDEFDPEELRTGGGNDLGFDALALVLNGDLVFDREEIRDLRSRNNYLQAKIIVVQARTSSSFDGSTITEIADNLCDFLSEHPTLPMNAEVSQFRELITELYSHGTAFRRGSPDLVIRYVSTGTWVDDPHLAAKLQAAGTRLRNLNIFETVDFSCLGARDLQALYRKAKNSVEATFQFPQRVVLPEIEGVEQAYIGIARVTEYLKLITDSSDNIRKSLFYDNVRDFQDYNDVNRGIRETLVDSQNVLAWWSSITESQSLPAKFT